MNKIKIPAKLNIILGAFVIIGLGALAAGYFSSHDGPLHQRSLAAILVLTFFILSVGLVGTFFATMQLAAGARWSTVLRRVPETFISLWPIIFILLGAVALNVDHIYHHWVAWKEINPHDHIMQVKSGYLNKPMFFAQIFGLTAILVGLGVVLRRISIKQDKTLDPKKRTTLVKISVAFILCFAYFFTLLSYNLVMSLEPHWYTTMFGLYTWSGAAYTGIAAIIIFVIVIQKLGGLKDVNEEHYHDLGKWQFMFVIFWAYIAFSQFMLMWYANMPEETVYLEKRIAGDWGTYTALFWILHFVVPFPILLSSKIKRNTSKMLAVCSFIFFMGFVDVIWMVYPAMDVKGFPVSWMEIGIFLAAVGSIGLAVLNSFARHSDTPLGDPHLEESKHFHQTH